MSFGKRRGVNNILPKLSFDYQIGKFYLSDRQQENGEWQTVQSPNIETEDFRAIADLAGGLVGWISFSKGNAPDMHLVRLGSDYGKAPSRSHHEGVRILFKMDPKLGGSVRECLNTDAGFWNGLNELHDAFLAETEEHPGLLPEVVIVEVEETIIPNGKIFTPHFEIIGWVPRPPDMPMLPAPEKPAAKPAEKTAKPVASAKKPSSHDFTPDKDIPF